MGPCKDGSARNACACSTGTSGAIGTCNCSPQTLNRQGQPCAYDTVNAVDSVS